MSQALALTLAVIFLIDSELYPYQVELKDTNYGCFLAVLEYLYTGQWPSQSLDNLSGLLALANFFCLPRLLALCEQHIVKEIQIAMAADELDVAEDVIGGWCFC